MDGACSKHRSDGIGALSGKPIRKRPPRRPRRRWKDNIKIDLKETV